MKTRPLTLLSTLLCSCLLAFAAPKTMHVSLILDDGPVSDQTPKLLAIFAEEKIHVTFGNIGKQAEANPELLKKVIAAGHESANHSYAHKAPDKIDAAAVEADVAEGQKAIIKACGVAPVLYWAPYCAIDDKVRAATAKVGLRIFPLDKLVVSGDYMNEVDGAEIFRRATSQIQDGSVILFHEWRPETAAQMKAIITELKHQGCVFLTFSEMLKYRAETKS